MAPKADIGVPFGVRDPGCRGQGSRPHGRPQVREGMRLSELPEQDSHGYAVAHVWV